MKKYNEEMECEVVMSEQKIMLGNEAIARGAYEAGVKVSAAYPGTPSTEISENIVKYDEIYAEWSPNEKVATEVAIGASISGVRAMASMKHVGLNVASDPLYTASYIGANGGLMLVVADDPGLYSSQNEQDTRAIARAALVPVLEPSDSQEAKEFVKEAFRISEEYDTPVILRTTTRLAHSQGPVTLEERIEPEDKPYERNAAKNVMMPGMAKQRHLHVEDRMNRLEADSSEFSINQVTYQDTSVGFITSGIPYQYVKEVCPDASVLKLGMVYPLPKKFIEEFKAFALKGNVMDMAIGVIIGAAFGAIVTARASTVPTFFVRKYWDKRWMPNHMKICLPVHRFSVRDVRIEAHFRY